MKKTILFFIFYFLFFISVANAAGLVPLVPCGGKDASGNSQPACTWCYLMQMFKNIVDFLIYIIFPIAAAMIVIGGISIMTAAGSPAKISKGREIITAAIIGLLIALFSWLIIDTIIKVLAGIPTGGGAGEILKGLGPWNTLKCS